MGKMASPVVVSTFSKFRVRPSELHTEADFSLYEGKKIRGWPVMTIKGGVVAVENNEILVEPGMGKVLKRPN